MKPNCIIIHGCPSNIEKAMDPKTRSYDKHWIPWTKEKLEQNSIETKTPLMPNPWEPDYQKFKEELEKNDINKNSILIGHSCGCAFLVRYLGDSKKKVKKLILVAPWKISERPNKIKEAFYNYQIDLTIKDRVEQIIYFTSDDEDPIGKKSLEMFHQVLGGKIIELKNHGHYTLNDLGQEEFPELLNVILKDI